VNPLVKKSLNYTGSLFAFAGIFFVVFRLQHYSTQLDYEKLNTTTWYVIFGSVLIYSAVNFMLGCTWKYLLMFFGITVTWCWALRTYGISQLAKYVPGNIFHFAGRQSLGLAAGLPGWPLAKSAIWEIGLIAFSGGLFGVLLFPLLFPSISVSIALGLFTAIFAVALLTMKYYFSVNFIKAFVCNLFFLTISGMIFVGLLFQISEVSVRCSMLIPLCGAYVIAWLAGLLTPGAPAGVGVRELVLLFLLKGIVDEKDLLLIIVSGRFVTVVGDVLFFILALLIKDRSRHDRV